VKRWLFLLVVGIPLVGVPMLAGMALMFSPTPSLPNFAEVKAGWRPSEAWLLDR